jgi:large repetitive protein
MKKFLLTNVRSNFSISNLTCVMNHLKFIQRVTVVVLLLLAGLSSRVAAQTCPTSNEITITVVPDLDITAQPIDVTECVSGTNTMFVTVTGGTGATSYQWQTSPTGAPGTFVDMPGETSASLTPISTTPGTTHFQVIISSAGTGCGAVTSTSAKAVITPQLTFTASPQDLTECINGTLPLTVTVAGATGTLSYKWKSSTSATGPFTAIVGAPDAATYTPPSTAVGTTYYQVEVSASGNGCTTITSTTATVTITPQLNISVTPQDVVECVGGNTPLTVTVAGATGALTYQWTSSSTGAPGSFSPMVGETNATLIPSSTTVGITYYQVIVKAAGNGCTDETSIAAKVEITPDMTISAQPTSIVQCLNGTQQLSVAVTGATGTITYQWQSSADGAPGSFVDVSGATAATYTPASAAVGTTYYQVVIKASGNGCGDVTSVSTTVEITPELSITAQPESITECINGTTPINVTVTGATGALTYKWKSSTTGAPGSFADIVGAPNAASYTPDASAVGTTYYQVEISAAGNGCDAITSLSSTVVVTPQLNITAQPQDITECVGGTTPLNLTITGATGALTYQWASSSTGAPGSFTAMVGETNATLTPSSTTVGVTYYQVEIKAAGNGCTSITSTAAKVEITPDMTISAQPTSIVQCLGGTQQLSVAVTGATGAVTYQWQSSADGAPGSFVDVASNGTSATYTPTSAGVGTTYYQVIIKAAGNGCGDVTSVSTTVEITPELNITAQPTSITECVGGNSPLIVTVAGATGALTYKWKSSTTGTPGSFTDVVGAPNAATYVPDASVAGTTYYQVEVSAAGNGCDAITTTSATVVITPQLNITAAPQNITQCIDGTNQLSVTVTGATGAISYQWQSSATGLAGSFADISGANSATYQPSSATAGITYYQVVVKATGNGCGDVTSTSATVEIIPDLSIAAQPQNITECISGDLALTVGVTGGTGIITYQWQSSPDGSSWTNIAGATSATYTPSSTAAGVTQYHVIITSTGTGCDPITSASATVTVTAKPTVTAAVSTTTVCVGGAVQLNATPVGGSGTCTIQWQNSTTPGTWNDIPGENGTTYTTPPLNANTQYRAQFICNGNGCCDK